VGGGRVFERKDMREKWEEFYDVLVNQFGLLCFGPDWILGNPGKGLVEAWLSMNGLGPLDIKEWFDK
jgi:hypothetical protein